MASELDVHPMAPAAERAFRKAVAAGAPLCVRWEPHAARWRVESHSEPGVYRHVARRQPLQERPYDPDRKPNPVGWFFVLSCDCPASNPPDGHQPWVICWHKAAAVLWCHVYHVLDPVVQRDAYDRALRRHDGLLAEWQRKVAAGEIDVSRFVSLTGNDPLPWGDGTWTVNGEDLSPVDALEFVPPGPERQQLLNQLERELPW